MGPSVCCALYCCGFAQFTIYQAVAPFSDDQQHTVGYASLTIPGTLGVGGASLCQSDGELIRSKILTRFCGFVLVPIQ